MGERLEKSLDHWQVDSRDQTTLTFQSHHKNIDFNSKLYGKPLDCFELKEMKYKLITGFVEEFHCVETGLESTRV